MSFRDAARRMAKRALGDTGFLLAKELQWSRSSEGRPIRSRILELKNAYRGRRCFIIGNGPSLTVDDLVKLRNEVTIGCNALFLLFDEIGFLPTFHTVEDRLVAEDRAAQINAITGTTKVFPLDLDYCLEDDDETLFLNFVRNYPRFPRFSTRLHNVAYWGGTVTFLNLQVALYLGCSPVYLIGIDHHYIVPENISGDVITSTSDDLNHFRKDYFGPGYRWHDPKTWRMEESYRVAKKVFESQGRLVANATRGGRLEIFERVDLDAVLSVDPDTIGA